MHSDDELIIKNEICPLISRGEVSLLLGAGFSYKNPTKTSALPSGEELKDILVAECGRKAGVRTSLKDAYLLAERNIPDFPAFLESCFTVETVCNWQEKIFHYVWKRIYTTNIDNVLSVAHREASKKGKAAADFVFFNYSDPNLTESTLGRIPVISIHGDITRPADGFIFSSLEYAIASTKILDWHNELAAKMLAGGLVVVGNQLDEPDIETHLAARVKSYGGKVGINWIVMPSPDDIKKENYIAAGYHVIDATAEEFFSAIYKYLAPKSIEDVLLETAPSIKKRFSSKKAMIWFKEAFNNVTLEIDRASGETGILRHFITGAHPSWFYVCNGAHATTSRIVDLTRVAASQLSAKATGIGVLHVIGPSGSGKTTAIRDMLKTLSKTYLSIYEYDSENGIDLDLLCSIVEAFSEKSVIVFYSASEFYYAVNTIANRLRGKPVPFCLFVLEERSNDYNKNKRQIPDCRDISEHFEFRELSYDDAKAIVTKMDEHGLQLGGFSDLTVEKRAGILVHKERGFAGDLLAALYSLTSHENFEHKIYQEYHSIEIGVPRNVLDAVAIMHHLGHVTPINYISGALGIRVDQVVAYLANDLSGVVTQADAKDKIGCRHRVLADYYFENFISQHGTVEFVVGLLEYLSRQFTISDIRLHPLPYQIYKKIISFDFLYDTYFPLSSRKNDTERTYHESQKLFGKDGVFWLHFGRFYRKIGELDNAIDCFRTGLEFYDSFQTRHSLGTALLEKYIEGLCIETSLYDEGVDHLERERSHRGTNDAYPTSTLCSLLIKIARLNPSNADVGPRLKENMNYGLKHFRGDRFFDQVTQDYFKRPQ